MFNPNDIKKDFPIFRNYPNLIFADNASTTQKPGIVIEAIKAAYEKSNANIHRAIYHLGVKADEIYLETKQEVLDHFGFSSDSHSTVFTSGTTDGINKLARSIGDQIKQEENIVVSEMEHHSNFLPWLELSKKKDIELKVGEITESGELNLDHMLNLIDKQTKVVSIVHISNTLGSINDLREIALKAKKVGAFLIIDAAQSACLYSKSLTLIEPDAIVFSGHKILGPTGIGAIVGKSSFLKSLPPMAYGGGMVQDVNKDNATYNQGVSKHEAGTPAIAQIAGLQTAIKYISSLDLIQCQKHLKMLALRLRNRLKDKVRFLGDPEQNAGIISCTFNDIHPHDAATFYNSKDIAVRAGHHCTQLIMKKFETPASVRFSFSIYNTADDVDKIIETTKEMKKYFA